MKFWTKILVATLALAMILSMVACGGKTDDNNDESKAESTEATPDATQPTESKPTEPDATEPDATEPDATEPDATEPDATEPDATEPDATQPTETKPNDEPVAPTEPDAQPDAIDIVEALTGFITGDALDGKLVATNGYLGTEFWTGTTLEGYAIMSSNPNMDDTKAMIAFDVAVTEFSLLKFNVKVDSDIGDVFYVYLDNKVYNGVGNRDAGVYEIAIPLSEGEHNVALCYAKDESGFDGTDTVYVSTGKLEPLATAIDGVKDEFYDDAQLIPVRNPYSSNPQGWQGGANAYITNDEFGIYIFVDVIDQVVVEDSNENFDDEDKVQLYIDFARSYYDEGLEGKDYRDTAVAGGMKMGWINCNPAGDNNPDGTFGGNYGFRDLTAFTAKSVVTDKGYAVEFFIPIAHGWIVDNTIGLGIQVSDDTYDADLDPNASFYSDSVANGAASWYTYYDTLPEITLK